MEHAGERKKSIVVIGGGTGTYTLLRGLKTYADLVDIKAVVTMADSGGSTGRLRDEFGYLPVGDVRMALTALARDTDTEDDILRKLFLYRFNRGEGLSGHTLGNLLLVALTDILGSEARAIEAAGRVLATCGEVIPVTTDNVHLEAEYNTGAVARSEHDIDEGVHVAHDAHVEHLSLSADATVSQRAKEAIRGAHIVVLGPGDLYTSILANCVVGGVPELIQTTKAKIVYVANLMSRRGQTHAMGTSEYLRELYAYTKRQPDYMVVHTAPIREDLLQLYQADGEYPVLHTYTESETKVIGGNFVSEEEVIRVKGDVLRRSLIRHDSHKLARAIMDLL
jgi:uncharacterized cofD-like protein